MSQSELALYSSDAIRACETQAVISYQLDPHELMSRAGAEAFFFILRTYPRAHHIAVFCGSGHNAGDGYILAKLAHEHGLSVTIYQCKTIEDLPLVAQTAAVAALDAGVTCCGIDEFDGEIDLIVDALLGIGLTGAVHGLIAHAIEQVNSSNVPIIALDIPSGLNADNGKADNYCVKATVTLSFIGLKRGLYTLDGPDYCGTIYGCSLQIETILEQISPSAWLFDTPVFPLASRKKNSHKGDYGHVLIIGGGPGMPGAAALAAKAALRAGAGAVTIATWPEHLAAILPLVPEAMLYGVSRPEELKPLLSRATCCVIGPGLGENEWARSLFLTAITSQLAMIVDASALRWLATYPQLDDNWVLTPHPGEAASLLGCSTSSIQDDRYQSIKEIQRRYGGVVVLKGCGSMVQTAEKKTFVCPKGNPGMASAGMGDVLSGIIAAFCAQGHSLSESAIQGVWVHAQAGDIAALAIGEQGLLASDLLNRIPQIINGMT